MRILFAAALALAATTSAAPAAVGPTQAAPVCEPGELLVRSIVAAGGQPWPAWSGTAAQRAVTYINAAGTGAPDLAGVADPVVTIVILPRGAGAYAVALVTTPDGCTFAKIGISDMVSLLDLFAAVAGLPL